MEAYEWASGPGVNCSSGQAGYIGSFPHGDFNLYTNYGWFYAEYDIPYYTETYIFKSSNRQSFSSSATEAENLVNGPSGAQCALK